MVNTLEFNLSIPTVYVFIKRFLKAAKSYQEVRPSFDINSINCLFFLTDFQFKIDKYNFLKNI